MMTNPSARPAARRKARLEEFRAAMPRVNSGGTKSPRESDRIAKSLSVSAIDPSDLRGLSSISTGQKLPTRAAADYDPEKSRIRMEGTFSSHNPGDRTGQQYALLHELGHHVQRLNPVQFGGRGYLGERDALAREEARSENYATTNSRGLLGKRAASPYDDAVAGGSYFSARMANVYKAERMAGSMPGDPPASKTSAKFRPNSHLQNPEASAPWTKGA